MRHAKARDTSNAAGKGGDGVLAWSCARLKTKALLLQLGNCCATLWWAQLDEGPEPRQAALVRLVRRTSFVTYC